MGSEHVLLVQRWLDAPSARCLQCQMVKALSCRPITQRRVPCRWYPLSQIAWQFMGSRPDAALAVQAPALHAVLATADAPRLCPRIAAASLVTTPPRLGLSSTRRVKHLDVAHACWQNCGAVMWQFFGWATVVAAWEACSWTTRSHGLRLQRHLPLAIPCLFLSRRSRLFQTLPSPSSPLPGGRVQLPTTAAGAAAVAAPRPQPAVQYARRAVGAVCRAHGSRRMAMAMTWRRRRPPWCTLPFSGPRGGAGHLAPACNWSEQGLAAQVAFQQLFGAELLIDAVSQQPAPRPV